MKTVADIAKHANMEEKTYRRDLTSGVVNYFMFGDEEAGIYNIAYTDGDGGLMLFEGYCETFEERGVAVHLVECKYCDISYSLMIALMQQLEEATNSEDFE
jgi:hypothetical protein